MSQVGNTWRPNDATPRQISQYGYTLDNRGQRTAVSVQGEAVGGSGFSWTWGYDSRGELTGATHSTDNTRDRAYDYDPIGNRIRSKAGPSSNPWFYYGCRNSLNQYTVFALGDGSCSPDPEWGTPAYDADGNLTNDGGIQHPGQYVGTPYAFVYDGENRLTAAMPSSPTTGSKKVTYTYDYRNRRVRRQVFNWNPNATPTPTWQTTPSEDTRYVWDGWLLLAELNGASSNALLRSYTWGLDLAGQWAGGLGTGGVRGSLEAAGGIGGLLAVHEGSSSNYVYTFDGNGNVSEVVDLSVGTWNPSTVMVAKYQYDPYGNVLGTPGGAYAATNRWRFSTKQFDSETNLGYWGRRWYSSQLGRWTNRDPIEEAGGANLYAYLQNASEGAQDPLGETGAGGVVGAVQVPAYVAAALAAAWAAVAILDTCSCESLPGVRLDAEKAVKDAQDAVVTMGGEITAKIISLQAAFVAACARAATRCAPKVDPCPTDPAPDPEPDPEPEPPPKADPKPPPQPKIDPVPPLPPLPPRYRPPRQQPRCAPCVPPVGTRKYEVHTTHKDHGWNPHTHHFQVEQEPYRPNHSNSCICKWRRNYVPTTQGDSPYAGETPILPSDWPVGGGGPMP